MITNNKIKIEQKLRAGDRVVNLLIKMSEGFIKQLLPTYDCRSEIGYSIPEAVTYLKVKPGEEFSLLDQLVERGLLIAKEKARVDLCPFCQNFHLKIYTACPSCKSIEIRRTSLIHHFRCGNVDVEEKFTQGEDLICPKCNKKLRHIGVDYEKPSQIFFCPYCQEPVSAPFEGYECIKCGKIFKKELAIERKIYAYRLSSEAPTLIAKGKIFDEIDPTIDNLTGVFKEKYFKEAVAKEGRRAARYKIVTSILKLNFKNWSKCLKTLGRGGCADILKDIATLLKENLREVDVIGRSGEHDFWILLPQTDANGAKVVQEKLEKVITNFFRSQKKDEILPEITISHKTLAGEKLQRHKFG
jgi:diguanylate cyclase (GGDEF)-like protein